MFPWFWKGSKKDLKRYAWTILIFILMHSYFQCHFVSIMCPHLEIVPSRMSTTLQYMVPGKEAAPAISHCNFHRVHGAQIAVFSGTCRKLVLTCRKPVESRRTIGKDRFSTRFGQGSTFASPYKTPFFAVETRENPSEKYGFLIVFGGPGIMCFECGGRN